MKPRRYGPFPYSPMIRRPKFAWPNGARIAVWIIPNIEFFALDEQISAAAGGGGKVPDIPGWSVRDYGNRIGVFRIMEVMDRYKARGTVALNSELCAEHPEIIEECIKRDWELMGHNESNNRRLNAVPPEEEGNVVRRTVDTIAKASGRKVKGWLSSGLNETWNSLDHFADCGLDYVADWANDDQPYVMTLDDGRKLMSVPYTFELNDKPAFEKAHRTPEEFAAMIRRQFDVLWREGETQARVMAIALHPYITGFPHRIGALDAGLEHICRHEGVWLATGSEIAEAGRKVLQAEIRTKKKKSREGTIMTKHAAPIFLACLGALVPVLAGPVQAQQTPEQFYTGKQMRFIIRSQPGGGYDQYARLLGRHIGRHIPGKPSVVPVNMPGGGGIVSVNYVVNVAPRDGTILTIVNQGLPVDQALGLNKTLKADMRQLNWIGNISNSNQLLVTWHTSKTKTLADAQKTETTIGSTGAGSISTQLPALYNFVANTRFRIIYGYPDGVDVNMAMERGELEGRSTNTWASYKSVSPHYISRKLINPIIQIGIRKEKDLPDVPLLLDLPMSAEDRAVVEFMSKAVSVGRPIATTQDVPKDRVAALRRAFDATLTDPAFIAEAEKQRAEVEPMPGEELARIVDDLISTPQPVLERVKIAIEPKKGETQKTETESKGGKKED